MIFLCQPQHHLIDNAVSTVNSTVGIMMDVHVWIELKRETVKQIFKIHIEQEIIYISRCNY